MGKYKFQYKNLMAPNSIEVAYSEYKTAIIILKSKKAGAGLASISYMLGYSMYKAWGEIEHFEFFNEHTRDLLARLTDTLITYYESFATDQPGIRQECLDVMSKLTAALQEENFESEARDILKQFYEETGEWWHKDND